MKKMKNLMDFKNNALNRAEMKAIIGGVIFCGCYYEGLGTILGKCSGPSPAVCNTYSCSGGGVMRGSCVYAQ